MRWWQVSEEEREKLFPHSEQRKGRSPVWDLRECGGTRHEGWAGPSPDPCCPLYAQFRPPNILERWPNPLRATGLHPKDLDRAGPTQAFWAPPETL